MYRNAHSNLIHNSREMETIQTSIVMRTDSEKQILAHSYKGIIVIKRRKSDAQSTTDESQKHSVKCRKPDTEEHV